MQHNRRFLSVLLIALSALLLWSCDASKKVPYFKDVTDTMKTTALIPELQYEEPTIMPMDVLQVTVQTLDAKTGEIFAQSGKTATESSLLGYQVDKDGEIELPILGRLHVGGLTTKEARELIREKATKYYKDPAVNVRFLSNYIMVLGDVPRAGRLTMISEKMSVMDAIGMAGDLPLTARKDNILLIREQDGKKLFVTFDLNSSKVFQSPYYYLRSGDILYVSAYKSKQRTVTADLSRDRYLTYITSFIYIFLTVYTLARVK
jgi:polysaccharide export outer membrane protein